MLKLLKWLFILCFIVILAVGISSYAPDRDPDELVEIYGASPSRFVPLPNGQKVHLRDEGPRDAPVLLMIHGSNGSLHGWQPWVDTLVSDYRIIRYDQPGHGLTGPQVKNDYSAEIMSDTAAMVMEQLGIDQYAVIGSSMGGWVAWNHALAYPDHVRAMVLVDASGAPIGQRGDRPFYAEYLQKPWAKPIFTRFTPRLLVERRLAAAYADPRKVSPEQVDLYWNLLRYPGNRAATLERGFERAPANAAQMAQIKAPTLILWGDQDTLTPLDGAKWFKQHIPGSVMTVYKNVGHLPMEEAPQRSANDLRQWLKDIGLGRDGNDPIAPQQEAPIGEVDDPNQPANAADPAADGAPMIGNEPLRGAGELPTIKAPPIVGPLNTRAPKTGSGEANRSSAASTDNAQREPKPENR